jgi:outer membrane protein
MVVRSALVLSLGLLGGCASQSVGVDLPPTLSASNRAAPEAEVSQAVEAAHAERRPVSPAAGGAIAAALADAYSFSPELNSARAGTRATDETLPQAKAGYRPNIAGAGALDYAATVPDPGASTKSTDGSLSLTVDQSLFRGFRTRNAVRGAEATIQASWQQLANVEQNVLFDAANAYFSVVRDQEVLKVRRADIDFLEKSVRATTDRFEGGEATKTDISQADARLAGARSDLSLAEAALRTSQAEFQRIIGHAPNVTTAYFPYASLLPHSLNEAISIAVSEHPVVLAAIYRADSSTFATKGTEGALLPTLSVSGTVGQTYGIAGDDKGSKELSGSVHAGLSVPLYQRGAVSSQIRSAKELEGQSKIEIDLARDQVVAATVSAWSQWMSSADAVAGAKAQVEAARASLTGVEEEQKVGQRTALDVLDAQQELLRAQLSLIQIENNRYLSSFSLLSAIGQLNAERLGLAVNVYRPQTHYDAVKNKWFGTRTPDGR